MLKQVSRFQLMQVASDGQILPVLERPGVPLRRFNLKREADQFALENPELITVKPKATMTLSVLEIVEVPDSQPVESK